MGFSDMVKLIVWDLDDTLWEGTLAEGDEVLPRREFFEAISKLNNQGIVNSIVSKNDFNVARAKLEELGYWDLFVFPCIAFEPKGSQVKQLLEDMSLRAPDCVFVDDNEVNLREVKFAVPSILALNPNDDDFRDWLSQLVDSTSSIKKSRVEQYRILESKKRDRESALSSNEDFLRSCDIRIAVIEHARNLNFESRLEELVNRTNQLNFTKSRMALGTMSDYITNVGEHLSYSLFVWDKYGYYGLVGFAGISQKGDEIEHFLFSCRTMNMGIESAFAGYIQDRLPTKELQFPVSKEIPDWVKIVEPSSAEFMALLDSDSLLASARDADLRVMANCQSGPIAHYSAISPVDTDAWPDIFSLQQFAKGEVVERFPRVVIYGAFQDYDPNYWDGGVLPEIDEYGELIRALLAKVEKDGSSMLVFLPPEEFTAIDESKFRTREQFSAWNQAWRDLEAEFSQRSLGRTLLKTVVVNRNRVVDDPRHFDRTTLIEMGNEARQFYESQPRLLNSRSETGKRKERNSSHLVPAASMSPSRALLPSRRFVGWIPSFDQVNNDAITWEVEISGSAKAIRRGTCVAFIEVSDFEAIRDRVDNVVKDTSSQKLFRYFGDNAGSFRSRFIISGTRPFGIISISLEGFGAYSEEQNVVIEKIEVWRHKK